jgi:thiamine kinase-like enzyme
VAGAPLEAVLESVPELRDATSVDELAGGLTNTNYKVTTATGAYVVRIAGKDTGLLAIDRENEVHNTIAAAEVGVGAPFVSSLPEHGALVLGYMEGETMSPEALRRGDRLGAIASACRRLHGARRFLADFDMFEIQPRYLRVVQDRGFRLPDRYLDFEPQARALEEAMRAHPERTVPCNNDLLAENLIDVGGELRLIDYEYSGNNEPSFELGNVWSESSLSLGQLEELVGHYYGAPSRAKVARARSWGLMAKYGWTLWGSIQEGISELDFDFWGWAMEKYERAVAEFDDPGFEALLAALREDR